MTVTLLKREWELISSPLSFGGFTVIEYKNEEIGNFLMTEVAQIILRNYPAKCKDDKIIEIESSIKKKKGKYIICFGFEKSYLNGIIKARKETGEFCICKLSKIVNKFCDFSDELKCIYPDCKDM
jgi:hypothetical protein